MKTLYVTTTLPYVNDRPHIGFAYEIVAADVFARQERLLGTSVFFNFGTDEHGQKIYNKALGDRKNPQAYVDEYAASFLELKKDLNLSFDAFIRTTNPDHKAAAQEFWKLCRSNGDIYKKKYRIRYCVGCELEKSDSELVEGKCPLHPKLEIESYDEENYFFRFSKYQVRLTEYYDSHPEFVVPAFRLNEMKSLIKNEGLQDFSISRLKAKMPWGVDVPDDPEHVMYVWFDALINYISTLGWPKGELFHSYWPGIQFAGKDQVRQQAAMWQAMLFSAQLPPSKQIFFHGFISVNGQKMSKSLGNVVYPSTLVKTYGTDAVRYYLLRHIHPFEDSDFSEEKFKEHYNANLAHGLGNLVARIMKMASENLSEPMVKPDVTQMYSKDVKEALKRYEFNVAIDLLWQQIQFLDQRIANEKPYVMVKTDQDKAKRVIASLVEGLYMLAHQLEPFLPETSNKIRHAILKNEKPETLFPLMT